MLVLEILHTISIVTNHNHHLSPLSSQSSFNPILIIAGSDDKKNEKAEEKPVTEEDEEERKKHEPEGKEENTDDKEKKDEKLAEQKQDRETEEKKKGTSPDDAKNATKAGSGETKPKVVIIKEAITSFEDKFGVPELSGKLFENAVKK